ncbi:phage putative head morphogenesis protein%2C SPP1 gp7 family [Streptococcus pneumoniae]|nr:phage putative head morphogenesis protein%2C SPP1 gp7 family [Streptococcus pneumoniae]CIX73425.1 phage putative head morphogenesis protein%2C SPP1 gp7 family [Streptococcus pneumoniae]CJG70359.1 phage putative head morphogenesis protein%2C SPP1 gp7 family [Streptococcus pneumoniae]CMW80996.1 phage putative head morphogenesis protein%2C SPP1 gp7 family [Streptococcus pneumoniae]CNA92708.1 phage putative head morphogenesis protein%2C SPP1 gp7 family [Streptococcus pneumoniae]
MDKAEKQADQFDKVYQEAKTYLDKEANKIFDKFQRDYGLSQVEARQVLKNMKDKKNLNELRKVLEARPNDPNIQRLLADLDSPAYSFRMKRLERLSDDLDRMRESIYHSEKTGSDAFYSDLMKDSYYKATFDLQQQTGLAYGFSGLPENEIKHLQSFSWVGDGSTYSTDIWKNTGKLTSSIKDELLMSLMTGRDTRETAQAIAERFNVGQNDARRLVRTESAFFHNQMELLSYEEADIEKYIFVAVLDKRTSRICQEHDNQVYDRDKAVPGVNCPPMHPWCRSTTVGYDEDADYSKLKRRARNPETGKVEYVPADMTYKEWYSKYVAKDGEKVYNQDTREAKAKFYSEQLLSKISGVEPKITSDMQRIAGENKLAGLEFRKKTVESLSRKIIADSLVENISLSKAVSKINDALRYTTIFDSDTFTEEYLKMKQKLIAEGYKIVKVKNTWLVDGPYKGVNTVVEKDGINFEMQYHTQESFDLKNGSLHELYEKYRDTNTSDLERMKLFKEMLDLSNGLEIPKNIERVK